jgi:hypothetical protein
MKLIVIYDIYKKFKIKKKNIIFGKSRMEKCFKMRYLNSQDEVIISLN